MSDYFALLGQPRRPWLNPDELKRDFLALSAQAHPDRVHGSSEAEKRAAQNRYAELNQAYQTLLNPKQRLQHLLELETGTKPAQVQQVPAELTEFFFPIAQLFRQTDAFLVEKAKKTSPLLQVQLFEAAQEWVEKLKAVQQQLNHRQRELEDELRNVDLRWTEEGNNNSAERQNILRQLEELYRLFSYYTKWEAQVQERIVQLSL